FLLQLTGPEISEMPFRIEAGVLQASAAKRFSTNLSTACALEPRTFFAPEQSCNRSAPSVYRVRCMRIPGSLQAYTIRTFFELRHPSHQQRHRLVSQRERTYPGTAVASPFAPATRRYSDPAG